MTTEFKLDSPFRAFFDGSPYGLSKQEWEIEFQIAEELLLDPSCPVNKIGRGNKYKNHALNREHFPYDPRWRQLTHSFFKFNHQVYAVLPHEDEALTLPRDEETIVNHSAWEQNQAFAGIGGFSIAKYAINRQFDPFIIKVQRKDRLDVSLFELEEKMSSDTGLLEGTFHRNIGGQDALYCLEPYLGENLHFLLQQRAFPYAERIHMSIQLLWLVYQLHHGHLSKTKTRYAHLDLKPENIVYCPYKRKVSLIDFGLATLFPNDRKLASEGTAGFRPNLSIRSTGRAHDLLSAKRVIMQPHHVVDQHVYMHVDSLLYTPLLSTQEVIRLSLQSAFNTNDEGGYDYETRTWTGNQGEHLKNDEEEDIEASYYGARIALSFSNISASSNQHLKANPELCSAIIALYFANQLTQENVDLIQRKKSICVKLAKLALFSPSFPYQIFNEYAKKILRGLKVSSFEMLVKVTSTTSGGYFEVNKTIERLSAIYNLPTLKYLLSNKGRFQQALTLERDNNLDCETLYLPADAITEDVDSGFTEIQPSWLLFFSCFGNTDTVVNCQQSRPTVKATA